MWTRVLTALVLIPPVLAAVFCTSPWPMGILLGLVTVLGLIEIVRMTGQILVALGAPFVILGILISSPSSHVANNAVPPDWQPFLAFGGTFLFMMAVIVLLALKPPPGKSQVHALLGGGWIAGPMASAFALHQSVSNGQLWLLANPILMAILPLWAGDTAAIFAGKAFGKHPMAPSISPKKTIEGGIANLIACVLAAWGIGIWIGIALPQSLACGLAAGILGQAGDLFESWVKRRAGLKDSGTLLPGHGGIMDRIDSILFTAPIVAVIQLFWK